MTTVGYTSPFVPPEWIKAHGLRPCWLRLREGSGSMATAPGLCSYAGALVTAGESSVIVLTTTCDQIRRAAGLVEQSGRQPVFLLNVPATWQTDTARRLYHDELKRLGRFLVNLGGTPPAPERLAEVILQYQRARRSLLAVRYQLSTAQYVEALAAMHGDAAVVDAPDKAPPPGAAVPLALLGGPLLASDYRIFDMIEEAGGRLVLDAVEGGARTMPADCDAERLQHDPFAAMADAYFDGVVDVFRRPNRPFHEWLAREVRASGARGLVLRRYVWCDQWHAESRRIKETCGLPTLDLDAWHDDDGSLNRTAGRIEAFLEMLQ